jgi:hypothetical protein
MLQDCKAVVGAKSTHHAKFTVVFSPVFTVKGACEAPLVTRQGAQVAQLNTQQVTWGSSSSSGGMLQLHSLLVLG